MAACSFSTFAAISTNSGGISHLDSFVSVYDQESQPRPNRLSVIRAHVVPILATARVVFFPFRVTESFLDMRKVVSNPVHTVSNFIVLRMAT